MDSNFNPDTFIDLEVTGALDTRLEPVPVGEWPATIKEVQKPRQATSPKDGKTYTFMEIMWEITDPQVEAHCQRTRPTVRQSISLDVSPQGGLDMGKGKNVGLGQLREALGLNDPSQSFAIRMLSGRGAKIKVGHRQDKDDPTKIFTDVKQVSRI